jgi:hypothetical protein
MRPHWFLNSALSTKNRLFRQFAFFASSLLLHHLYFSIDIFIVLLLARPPYNDLERRTLGDSLLAVSTIFVFP